ncbi:unnamed protein product [Caretta caretta]
MKKKDEEAKTKLDESEENTRNIESEISRKEKQLKMLENKFNNLKKQIENKTKYNEELQQENKVLKKNIAAESKQSSIYEEKMNKLQLELENVSRQHKETVDSYQKEIEAKNVTEEKLIEKHQYDKMAEEKDTELELCKTKEQEQMSVKQSLETELSHVKSELLSLKEQVKIEIKEKEKLTREAKENAVSEKEKKHKTYTVKTPPKYKLQRESMNPLSEEDMKKKRKVVLELDTHSDSSEHNDLLSIVSEEEMFKKLYKNCPQASRLCVMTPKKIPTLSIIKSPGAALKLTAMRKMRETGWTAVSKMDRKKKMKEAEKLFA